MGIFSSIKAKMTMEQRYSLSFMKLFFWDINWIKTIWFNFKVLPFRLAIKMPIVISYNTKIKNTGEIILPDNAYFGMFSIGVIKIATLEANDYKIVLNNQGTFKVGGLIKIHPGARIYVAKDATLSVGNLVGIGANSKVVCFKDIVSGDNFRMSWNSQIFDTDFHFLQNVSKGFYYHRTKPIRIGDNVFVGNGSTIGKGTILQDGCVISCMSKVSGDFTADGKNLLLSGVPAKIVKVGVEMSSSFYLDKEEELAREFEQ